MLFSIYLGGTEASQLADLEDALRPLVFGLRRSGHRVIALAQDIAAPPALNLVIEHDGADLARRMADVAAVAGARVGVFCSEDLGSVAADRPRWAALHDAAARVDFVWSVGPTEASARLGLGRLATIEYGYDPVMAGRRLVTSATGRDAGLVVYGPRTPYRMSIVEQLKGAGLTPFVVEPSQFPDYIASDLLSRARLVVVTRDHEAAAGPPAARLARAIANGAVVLAEAAIDGAVPLGAYVTACSAPELPVRCQQLLAQSDLAALGIAGCERFRAKTSMAAGVAAAVAKLGV